MICTRFIHIHIPRTGGSFFRSVVNECIIKPGIIKMIDGRAHMHFDESKALAPNAKVVTIVRNPFDWYVSRYHRAIDTGTFSGSFNSYLSDKMACGETMTRMWNDYMDGKKADVVLRFELLGDQIADFIIREFPKVGAKNVRDSMRKLGKVRESVGRLPVERYYNTESAEVVAKQDAQMLEEFLYAPMVPIDTISDIEATRNGGWY